MTKFQLLQFPCSHQQIKCSLPSSFPHYRVKIECKLNFQEFERLVTYRIDDIGQLSGVPITPYRLSNSTATDSFSPFCAYCHSNIVDLMKSFGHCDESSDKLWEEVKDYVCNELSSLLSKELDYSKEHWWDIPAYTDHVCDNTEVLRAWMERVGVVRGGGDAAYSGKQG